MALQKIQPQPVFVDQIIEVSFVNRWSVRTMGQCTKLDWAVNVLEILLDDFVKILFARTMGLQIMQDQSVLAAQTIQADFVRI